MKKPFTKLLALSASLGWLGTSTLQAQTPPLFGSETRLQASEPSSPAAYGRSVAAFGNLVVVGEPLTGKVDIHDRNFGGPDQWGRFQTLKPTVTATTSGFGERVAMHDGVIAVSSTAEDKVYIFERDSDGNWGRLDPITPTSASSSFGNAVDVFGDTLVVGTPGNNTVFVYRRDSEGTWLLEDDSLANGLTLGFGAQFGSAVAISGNTIAVGAPGDNYGAVFVFERGDEAWNLKAKIEGASLGEFGCAVDLDGNTLVVGAQSADGVVPGSGAAYVFNLENLTDSEPVSTLTSATAGNGSLFGSAVSIWGDLVLVGAPGIGANLVEVFQRQAVPPETWTKVQTLSSAYPNAEFYGGSVALAPGFAAVGALASTDSSATQTGAAFVYSLLAAGLLDEHVTVHYHDGDAPDATDASKGYSKADIRGTMCFSENGIIPDFIPASAAPTVQAHVMAWLGSQLIASAPVLLDIAGNNRDKWEGKPATGPVDKLKIHWDGAVEFNCSESNPGSPKIKSKFIGLTETEVRYEAKPGTYQTAFPNHGVTVNVVAGKITAISGAPTYEIESDKKQADITFNGRLVAGEQMITTGNISDTITVTSGVNYTTAQGKFELKLREDGAPTQPLFALGVPLEYIIVLGTGPGEFPVEANSVVGIAPKLWDADDNNHKRYHEDTSD